MCSHNILAAGGGSILGSKDTWGLL